MNERLIQLYLCSRSQFIYFTIPYYLAKDNLIKGKDLLFFVPRESDPALGGFHQLLQIGPRGFQGPADIFFSSFF